MPHSPLWYIDLKYFKSARYNTGNVSITNSECRELQSLVLQGDYCLHRLGRNVSVLVQCRREMVGQFDSSKQSREHFVSKLL